MTSRTSARAIAAALCCALAACPLGGRAAEAPLRFASISAAGTASYTDALVPFAANVARDSGKRLDVALKPLGGYGRPSELFGMVERGEIEMASTVQGYSPGRFPRSSVMELPLMYDTAVTGTKALGRLHEEGLLGGEYASVKVIALYALPPYGIFTSGRQFTELRDLRGLRVRTPGPTVGLALGRLGMIPLGVPVNMIGDTIANGTVDAITFGWDSLATTKGAGGAMLADQVKVLIDANFAGPTMMIVMNRARWEALPPDLQAVIARHGANLGLDSARLRDAAEAASRTALRANPRYTYTTLTPAQREAMERRIAPAVGEWKAAMARAGIDGERLHARARELVARSATGAE